MEKVMETCKKSNSRFDSDKGFSIYWCQSINGHKTYGRWSINFHQTWIWSSSFLTIPKNAQNYKSDERAMYIWNDTQRPQNFEHPIFACMEPQAQWQGKYRTIRFLGQKFQIRIR
jgi:hypothetical protein